MTTVAELIVEFEAAGITLWEESGALRFRAPKGAMTTDRRDRLRQCREEVIAQLRDGPELALVPDPDARHLPFPLTDVQSAYLLGRNTLFDYGGVACHGYGEIPFPHLDFDRLQRAWQHLVRRHDMLRAVIDADGSQRVLPSVPDYRIRVVDVRGTVDGAAAAVTAARAEMSHQMHDPGVWPLFELRVTLAEETSILHFSIDLLIADFASTQRLLAELHLLYTDPETTLPALDITFRDYVLATADKQRTIEYQRHRAYWLRRIDTLPPAPELAMNDPAAPGPPPRFRRRSTALSGAEWTALRAYAAESAVTDSGALLGAYAETIGRWSRHRSFTLTVTMLNRYPLHPQVGALVGDFTSTNLLAIAPPQGSSLAERVAAAQAQLWSDMDHRRFTGLDVARELARRAHGESVLFPVVFTSALGLGADADTAGVGEFGYGITQTPQVWIDCQVLPRRDGVAINWDIREGVLRDDVVDDMFDAFAALLHRMSAGPDVWRQHHPIPLPAAQQRCRAAVRQSAPLSGTLLHEGVFAQAARTPDGIAVVDTRQTLSYAQLCDRAAAVANVLQDNGFDPGELAAVVMDKGVAQVVAVLGILLAGGAYLPVDTSQPPMRRRDILADAGVRQVLTQPWIDPDDSDGTTWLVVDTTAPVPLEQPRAERHRRDPGDLAYVIYTSGSTGRPKGVMISHRAAVNTLDDINRRFHVTAADRVLGLAQLGFDLSVYDIFGTLAVGGTLVLPVPERRSDPAHWAELIAEHGVTVWNSVPAQLQMLDYYLESGAECDLSALRLALLSGDWIPVDLPDRLRSRLPGLSMVSLGGATEAAVWSICFPIEDGSKSWRSIPYGTPLTNQTVDVLDDFGQPCPDWTTGELYIGGAGVALGYLGDPRRTAERFIEDPETGVRHYRTGDLGRFRDDGVIEFLGREDRQVKVRGHRIELAEIEYCLATHPAVSGAALVAAGDRQDRRLAAFVTAATLPGAAETAVAAGPAAAAATFSAETDPVEYAEYYSALTAKALAVMWSTLRTLGFFDVVTDRHRAEQITAAVRPEHARLVRRWLRTLVRSGRLRMENGEYLSAAPVADEPPWDRIARMAYRFGEAELIRYIRASADKLPDLLTGAQDPLGLLFPQGRSDVAEAVYSCSAGSRGAAARMDAALRHLIAAWPSGRRLRVLEVGGGSGGSARGRIETAADRDVDYLFTDLSTFFLGDARQRLGAAPWLRMAVFDLEQHYRPQGFAPNTFDVIVAADVLHATRDIDGVLRRLGELLAPGGWLLLSEMTRDHPHVMISLELLLGRAEEIVDERGGRDEVFLGTEQWQRALGRAGFRNVRQLPESDAAVAGLGIAVFAAQAKPDRARIDIGELTDYLRQRLPDHMVPAELQVIDALPLTGNGKVDQRTLESWLSHRTTDRPAALDEERGSELETQLASRWAQALRRDTVGRNQNFFELGGDSLVAARLARLVGETVPAAEPILFDDLLRMILTAQTVAGMAAEIAALDTVDTGTTGPRLELRQILGPPDSESATVLFADDTGQLPDGYRAGSVFAAVCGPDAGRVTPLADECAATLLDRGIDEFQLVGLGFGGLLAVETACALAEAGARVNSVTAIGMSHPDAFVVGPAAAALDGFEARVYAGDLMLVRDGDSDLAWSDTIAYWTGRCLGELHIVEASPT
ncbi:amino acid adenylation domain-containing protein [Nocardia brasiliensis]|uniref:non-ribosomal peptide synthetase n=1 Tax=Nocardia brasiliensis TaxID=37326 RepID=UPI0036724E75